jgi:hypothetical protein
MIEVRRGDAREIVTVVPFTARLLIITERVSECRTFAVTPSVITIPAPILPVVNKVLPSIFLK